jgi:hyperosmotically inducible periplasmic protein
MHRLDMRRLFKTGHSMLGRNTTADPLTGSEPISDAVITARIKMKLLAHATTAAHEFQIETQDGTVAISGCVGTPVIRDVALQLARHAEGVRDVVDSIQVRRAD